MCEIKLAVLRRIKDDALAGDLDTLSIYPRCVDMDIMIEQYDKFLSDLLDKHAPLKNILYIVDMLLNERMTNRNAVLRHALVATQFYGML